MDHAHLERLRLDDKWGDPVMVPCAELTLFWRGSMFDRAEALLALHDRVKNDLASVATFYETGRMAGAKLVGDKTWTILPDWLQRPKRRDDIFMLTVESGTKRDKPSAQYFTFAADEEDEQPCGTLRIGLPIELLVNQPDLFEKKVVEYVGDLEFESGHAGFGVNWNPVDDTCHAAAWRMAELAVEARGVDYFHRDMELGAIRKSVSPGIKHVSWLTLLGDAVLKRCGGAEEMTRSLSTDVSLTPLSRGLLVRAGHEARLGTPDDEMVDYRTVGKALAPVRWKRHPHLFSSVDDRGRNATAIWLSRFDD